VDNKCSQQIENFKYLHYEISYENEKDVPQKLSFFFKYWKLRITTVNQLGSSNLEGRKYIMHWLSQLFSIEGKFWLSDKRMKTTDIIGDGTLQKNRVAGQLKEWKNFGKFGSRTSRRETNRIQIKLATTYKKNEQQQDARNNAEL